jgi:DNA mismatch repair ATPase MutS
MTLQELSAFYKGRFDTFSQSLEKVRSRINLISNVRLALAAAILITFYFALTQNGQLFYLLILEIVVFILFIRQHAELFRKRTHLENLIRIQTNELAGLEGNYNVFDAGQQFIDSHHPYTHDLDIFGEGSLFQTINRCSTVSGKAELASRLSHPILDRSRIKNIQSAVAELSKQPEFCHELQAAGMEIGETQQDRAQLLEWLKHRPFLFGKFFFRIALWVLPIVTVSAIVLSIWFDGIGGLIWLCAAMQWLILALNLRKVNDFHEYIGKKKNTLERYAQLLRVVEKQKFDTSLLSDLQSKSHTAYEKVTRLATWSRSLDARLNWMTNLFANSILMFDLQCVYRLEQWKEENAQSLGQWLDVVKEIEVIVSLGTFAFNNEDLIFPKTNTSRTLHAIGMGHPLIAASERVVNDVTLNENESILIITGANMAGKSTFLRTLGVNVVLALAGAPVCANEFDCPLIEIRSGMRTADSLKDHQSYFYAELNRLKSIVDELKTGKHLLILLDEILKGTNSTDKQAGSIALVKQLINYPSLVLIATHDLVLGELENEHPQQIRNYCFEPSIVDDQLSFDYKLKRGIATKMNATFLMKKMGIIPR